MDLAKIYYKWKKVDTMATLETPSIIKKLKNIFFWPESNPIPIQKKEIQVFWNQQRKDSTKTKQLPALHHEWYSGSEPSLPSSLWNLNHNPTSCTEDKTLKLTFEKPPGIWKPGSKLIDFVFLTGQFLFSF